MKNIMAKIIGTAGFVAADLGLEAAIVMGLSKIWQKHELTDEYVNEHPKLAIARLMARLFITIAALLLICVAPVNWVINKIWDFCDEHFVDEPKVKDEWN